MTQEELSQIVNLLGVNGAIVGLEKSELTNAELMVIARESGRVVDQKTPRRQLIIELVMSDQKRIEKSQEYLLKMSTEELNRYFNDRMVSSHEILALLQDLRIPPGRKVKGKIAAYAAREIGELGMFERVANGTPSKRPKQSVEELLTTRPVARSGR